MRTAYYNGQVYTGKLPLQEAFLVEDGRFGRTGSDAQILALLEPGERKIDLKGRFVCPGFKDSHMHLLSFGNTLYGAKLGEHTTSLRELLDYLKEYLEEKRPAPGQWIKGRGWNQDYFRDAERMPDRHDLDGVSAEVPIVITRTCGHSCVVNSPALKAAGISRNTPDPEGGAIGRDAGGEPDGRLYENAIGLLDAARPAPGREEIRQMLTLAMEEANRYGITSVQTDDYSTFGSVSWELINDVYRELEAEDRLTVRVTEQANLPELSDLKALIEREVPYRKNKSLREGGPGFQIGPLKLLGDGSLGSRTAHLSLPYPGSGGECGFSLFSPEYLKEMVAFAHDHGMPAIVHAIGDACLDEVLDAIESALKKNPGADRRHGIVHCQISRRDQLERMAGLGVHIYAQSIFLDYDNHIVEKLVPEELARTSYSWKTLRKMGLCVSNGSDCPVELPDVMKGIQCAVTRRSMDGTGPYLPEEAFTVQEALESFTSAGARASFEENEKGCIREGQLADFVILSDNPFETDPGKLSGILVLETVLGGRSVYCRDQEEFL